MQWRLPKALSQGDEVAVVLPASGVRDRDAFARGMQRLVDWGLRPSVVSRGAPYETVDWPEGSTLAATDEERLQGLQRAFSDPRYRAVFCARGGYGSGRLLADVDWTPLVEDPKPIVGYSDITALLAAAAAEVGLVTFHGPMVATAMSMDPGDDGWQMQLQLLTDAGAPASVPERDGGLAIRSGVAEGRLLGGNLAVLQATVGTRWQPDPEGALLFLEDVGEAPYRVDRMLTQLIQCGWLARAAGVVLGDFHVADTELASMHPPMLAVFEERLADLGIPVVAGMAFGHRPGSWTLPFGGRALLDADGDGAPTLRLLEPCVQ